MTSLKIHHNNNVFLTFLCLWDEDGKLNDDISTYCGYWQMLIHIHNLTRHISLAGTLAVLSSPSSLCLSLCSLTHLCYFEWKSALTLTVMATCNALWVPGWCTHNGQTVVCETLDTLRQPSSFSAVRLYCCGVVIVISFKCTTFVFDLRQRCPCRNSRTTQVS